MHTVSPCKRIKQNSHQRKRECPKKYHLCDCVTKTVRQYTYAAFKYSLNINNDKPV